MPDSNSAWRNALDEVSAGLVESTDRIRKALLAVAQHAAADVGAAESSVLVPSAEQPVLRFLVSFSPHADELAKLRVPIASSVAGRVYATGQMIAIEDEPPAVPVPGEHPKVYLAYPISLSDRTLGVATFVNRIGEPPYERFSKGEMQIASRYAAVEAILLRQYLRLRTLSRLATRDLTTAILETTGERLPEKVSSSDDDDLGDDMWRKTALHLSSLGDNEILLCARMVGVLREWLDGTLE